MNARVHATIRKTPADFVVDELPAYAPSGAGEHLFVTFRKTGETTLRAVDLIAAVLGVDPRGAGFAGMKDRHAVTTQTASFPFPIARDAQAALEGKSLPGIEIVSYARHGNKLKPGHLVGNRFTIVLRDVPREHFGELVSAFDAMAARGVPNAFGPQRFGRDGDNPARALTWIAGGKGPRDRRQQRLLFSSLQSLWFNRALARRVEAGTWATVLAGDIAKKHDSGGLFTVPADPPGLDDAVARAASGAISATGPIFGASMRWPEGQPAALEREILAEALPDPSRLDALRSLGEGTRRPLRVLLADASLHADDPEPGALTARFVLPKGAYATTVLGTICTLREAIPGTDEGAAASPGGMDEPSPAEDG